MKAVVDENFWKNKRVFITGHTGFKGSWLIVWLNHLGANLKGYALEAPTSPSLYEEAKIADLIDGEIGDIRDLEKLTHSMVSFNPDIIIHMAAQPLVRLSYEQPIETYSTNVMGTVNIYEAAKACVNLGCIVNVTTDKCYENQEWDWGYREVDPMGGHDPYSNSKGCSELVTSAYRRSYFSKSDTPNLASARAGNVIGGGDWALDRLVPDALRAFERNDSVLVRNPMSIRPWQHVLEPLSGYIVLAQKLYENKDYAEGWNFGPYDKDVQTVEWILDNMAGEWGQGAGWELDREPQLHEAKFLKLDISKAQAMLGWQPCWSLFETIGKIVQWHKTWLSGEDMQNYCVREIQSYVSDMKVV